MAPLGLGPSATAGQQAPSFTIRANGKSRTTKTSRFHPCLLERLLFGGQGTDIQALAVTLVPFRAGIAMRAILDIVLLVLDLYVWLLIASAILSWLIAFNVVNTRNQVVAMAAEFLYKITEPVLRPIRNIMPDLGGLDISPIIVILIIYFIKLVIAYYIYPYVF